jgi:hypothetical protein
LFTCLGVLTFRLCASPNGPCQEQHERLRAKSYKVLAKAREDAARKKGYNSQQTRNELKPFVKLGHEMARTLEDECCPEQWIVLYDVTP